MKKTELTALLEDMSLEEKIAQMVQVYGSCYLEDEESAVTGPLAALPVSEDGKTQLVGTVLGTGEAKSLIRLQKENLARQPHHIPMMFMMDVIHGMATIFPAPIAQGATFDPAMYEKAMSAAAKEAAASGLHVTFSPMCDLVRDARWGRVVESTGEDPYLNGEMAAAAVRGFQGEKREDIRKKGHVCACVKHFAGYGGAVGGRDYNAAEMSERTFRDFYLPGYRKAIEADAGMVMTSFNLLNGIPASVNQRLMRGILRKELGFDGVLISDYAALAESIVHGCSADEEEAARKGVEAGVDIDMMSTVYASGLKKLVEAGEVPESLVDECVLRILELKNELGLFENPYKDADPEEEKKLHLCKEHRELARRNAEESFVLLKNEGEKPLLPLETGGRQEKIAFIGPYVNRKEMNSSWAITGNPKDNVTIREAAERVFDEGRTFYAEGCAILGKEDAGQLIGTPEYPMKELSFEEEEKLLREALEAAEKADVVILCLGEHYLQTGEAASRADITLPGVQMNLLRRVSAVNPNVVTVLFNGRPLDLREVSERSRSVLEVWLPGTEGGNAIVNTLTGRNNPQGKLPISFPWCVGQVPVFYNTGSTGRPYYEGCRDKFISKYLDIPNKPLYAFGWGLSYTTFEISEVKFESDIDMSLSNSSNGADAPAAAFGKTACADFASAGYQLESDILRTRTERPSEEPSVGEKPGNTAENDKLTASVIVTNTGKCVGTETVQLYLQDVSASVPRPVKELKGFRKVTLAPGESAEVSFVIEEPMLRFTREDNTFGSEPGRFRVWIADSSETGEAKEFYLEK